MERIHRKHIWEIMQRKDPLGRAVPFSMTFVKRSTGEMREVTSCTLTSIHVKGSTLKVMFPNESKPKSIRKCLIIKFNGKIVYL